MLDIGCSFGYGSAAIQAGGPEGRVVVGVERDPDHLRGAHERFPWITVLEGDATELPRARRRGRRGDDARHRRARRPPRGGDRRGAAGRPRRRGARRERAAPRAAAPARRAQRLRGAAAPPARTGRRWRRPRNPAGTSTATSASRSSRRCCARTSRSTAWRGPASGSRSSSTWGCWCCASRCAPSGSTRALLPLHLVIYLLDDLLPLGRFGYHLTVRARAVPAGGGA